MSPLALIGFLMNRASSCMVAGEILARTLLRGETQLGVRISVGSIVTRGLPPCSLRPELAAEAVALMLNEYASDLPAGGAE